MRIRTVTDVAATIRARRRALGIDQATLAKHVGVGRQWIVEIEKGKPRAALGLILRTLDTLGVVLRIDRRQTDRLKPMLGVDLDALLDAHREPRRKDEG